MRRGLVVVDLTDRRLANAAVRYATEGWRAFPYRGTSKRPRTAHGSHDATSDAETVAAWWRRHPADNIGVRIPDDLAVVDLDRHGDPAGHCRWTPADFPETLTTVTGSGWHLWYRAPPARLRSTSELPDWQGVEIKRHAVTVPPSVHANGTRYTWRRTHVVRLPALIADAFERGEPRHPSGSGEPSDRYVAAARDGIRADLSAVEGPGNHHGPLVRAAFRYRDLGLTVDDALADLVPLVPGHDEREARRTVVSVWR